jgi:phage shock protein C
MTLRRPANSNLRRSVLILGCVLGVRTRRRRRGARGGPGRAQVRPWQRRPYPYRLRPADHQLAAGDGHPALDQGPDPTLIRVVFVLLNLLGGAGIVLYLLLWIIVPNEPEGAA